MKEELYKERTKEESQARKESNVCGMAKLTIFILHEKPR